MFNELMTEEAVYLFFPDMLSVHKLCVPELFCPVHMAEKAFLPGYIALSDPD